MEKEPALVFKLSRPNIFRCSACRSPFQGEIAADGWVVDVIEVFREHVRRYHSKAVTLPHHIQAEAPLAKV